MSWGATESIPASVWGAETSVVPDAGSFGDPWGTGESDAFAPGGASKYTDGKAGNGDDNCRNCGEAGHFARECPEPKKMMGGACFNCGQVGHNKADCTAPREFTGTCRVCDEQGHPASECPKRPPDICKNCKAEGHKVAECTRNRLVDYSNVIDMTATEAWTKTREADQAKDADEFRNFVRVYCKTSPDVTFVDLEKVLRKEKLNFHLIAVEKEIADTQTIVNLQGKTGCKYQAQFHLDPRPKRKKLALGWPDNAEQNLERLKDAGFVEDAFKVKCDNCGAIGHTAKFCKEERKSIEHIIVKCANCDETGHRVRDCTKARVSKSNCRNCHQPGHRANECTEPRSAEGVECKRCGQTGHFAKDCSDSSGGDRSCRNCGKEGHMAKECEEPRNPATVTCRNCDETGHFSKDCSKPRDYSRVKCNNCGEMGHTIVRCKKPALDQDAGGFNQASTETIGDDDGVDAGDVGGW